MKYTHYRRSHAIGALLIVFVLVALSGCGESASQAQLVPNPQATDVQDEGLTPLERGQIRREVVEFSEEAVGAWLAGNSAQYENYFAGLALEHFQEVAAEMQQAGTTRVRDHERLFLDAVDMNRDGTEALVEYRFIENSYSADTSGSRLTEPVGEEKLVQLTVDQTEDGWRIVRIIADPEVLQ